MTNVIEIRPEVNEADARAALGALCLEGARQVPHQALEVEVTAYIEWHCGERDEKAHVLVTRNGKAQAAPGDDACGCLSPVHPFQMI